MRGPDATGDLRLRTRDAPKPTNVSTNADPVTDRNGTLTSPATARPSNVLPCLDPWGFGNSLEWATSCPPPRHDFTELPRIRSERPAFELHHPHVVERARREARAGFTGR